MQDCTSAPTLPVMLRTFINRADGLDERRFLKAASAYVRRVCRARAPDLAADLLRDVTQEAMVNLLSIDTAVLDATVDTTRLLRHAVLAAVRKVRADHAPAGVRTRRHRGERRDRIAAEDACRIPSPAAVEAATSRDDGHMALNVDRFACPAAGLAALQADLRVEADAALARLPCDVARALRLIHLEDGTIAEAADVVGVSRFALHRRIERHCAPLRSAA